ncbi:MAG: hypothetical protein J6S60_04760 [Oscillospiraceae bacterium]|nr:hypothetical protein [Oscillospiraceae bacterium]
MKSYIVYAVDMKVIKSAVFGTIYGVNDCIRSADDLDRTELARVSTEVQAMKVAIPRGCGSVTVEGDYLHITATVIDEIEVDTSGYTDPSDFSSERIIYVSMVEDHTA